MEQFTKLLEEKGISLSPHQLKQFHTYYELLVEWNKKMNLTAITEKDDVYLKHFYDSITPGFYYPFSEHQSLCDVGSGAGFPSIPLKIVYPEIKVTIVDSLKKRLTFLQEVIDKLALKQVTLYHDRAELFAKKPDIRESFDIVSARAVAHLSVLSEYCLPLVKVGGQFIALKGAQAKDELKNSEHALTVLGGKISKLESLVLPEENSLRHIIFIEKNKQTPKKYPRKPGTPSKSPL
ncbi:16S rRNA (guanine(527)-N(7))-methyltransferase RsmG [Terrilactibacillus sp. BCM23-1]|uniref:Ribosomal RNA small subunit methyltransferase G n=1 Tax=Terrilactibacillus tamarindi TaxID=2599694 RepID=A0A6N8CNB7_9BACI|nr:16S rRNA (guanine(527)-N(7))-methyltransferase RsmG [Terrilactibacillus tamarindi]MTT31060.1 16S rRNA (guanine(527)-N(7))-methyltransferase RsmG [Terrilactibacillus tamarindi]